MADNIKIFSENIKKYREKIGYTQRELARRIGATPTSVSAYEKGTKNPSLGMAVAIAKALLISVDTLCGLKCDPVIDSVADAINAIMTIEEKARADIVQVPDESAEGGLRPAVRFQDDRISAFLTGWDAVRTKHNRNIIDTELYFAWIEKQLRDHADEKLEARF